ncbi:aldo/keto reductase [Streptococcus ovuberis]|uniref:Aldo/keto reductase n=1 Tax=Streptococcus ovuberis TaxID=1936207 RepID=A0A7X6MYI4_9STRE|nr:aldo/keto reductase [Streptococcus ovuberis]NKZ20755.1 aldo/keto reductase [Streptococcus ovuberis]
MEYVNLGRTGLKVSRVGLGCMSFGTPDAGGIPGKVTEKEARGIVKYALDAGINFFDTANYYSLGLSEEILGRALKDFANREEVIISTKLYYPMFDGANAKGLSRKAIFDQVENSLKRLGTDYIDLYVIHRWDYTTPIEEVMEALNDLVRMGKVRYIGASSMYAWQFVKANSIADKRGWAKFVSMQNTINLIYREEEKEMFPMCLSEGIAVTPYSPIAHGALTRPPEELGRSSSSQLQSPYVLEHDREIIRRTREIAAKYQVSPGQVALAWVYAKPGVTAPLIGGSKIAYVQEAIDALELVLSAEDIAYLEAPYVPHKQYGFR